MRVPPAPDPAVTWHQLLWLVLAPEQPVWQAGPNSLQAPTVMVVGVVPAGMPRYDFHLGPRSHREQ